MALKGYKEVAFVKFIESNNTEKVYRFALYDHAVGVGDCALVKSNNDYNKANFGVVKVVNIESVTEYTDAAPTAEIICKVDMDDYIKRVEMRKERVVLKKKMDKLIKDSLVVYRAVAAQNSEMAELLEAYNNTLDA